MILVNGKGNEMPWTFMMKSEKSKVRSKKSKIEVNEIPLVIGTGIIDPGTRD